MTNYLKFGIGLLVSGLCVAYLFTQIELEELVIALKSTQWHYLILGLISLTLGYLLRIQRWALMIKATGTIVSFKSCSSAFMASIALNNIFPLRAGDIVRAMVFPKSLGMERSAATATLIFERLADLLTLLICLVFSIAFSHLENLPLWLVNSVKGLTMAIIVLTLIFLFFNKYFLRKVELGITHCKDKNHLLLSQLLSWVHSMTDYFIRIFNKGNLFIFLLSSLAIWMFEAGLFYAVLIGVGLNLTFTAALLVMAIATFSTMVPSSPGYIGPFHLAAFTAVTMLGGNNTQAVSFAVLVHLCLWGLTTIVGVISLCSSPTLFQFNKFNKKLVSLER